MSLSTFLLSPPSPIFTTPSTTLSPNFVDNLPPQTADRLLNNQSITNFLTLPLSNELSDIESFGLPKTSDIVFFNETSEALTKSNNSSTVNLSESSNSVRNTSLPLKTSARGPLPINSHDGEGSSYFTYSLTETTKNEVPSVSRESSYSSYGAPPEKPETEVTTTTTTTATEVTEAPSKKTEDVVDFFAQGSTLLSVLYWIYLKGSFLLGRRRRSTESLWDDDRFSHEILANVRFILYIHLFKIFINFKTFLY